MSSPMRENGFLLLKRADLLGVADGSLTEHSVNDAVQIKSTGGKYEISLLNAIL